MTMTLLLVRHGLPDMKHSDDFTRPLTQQGKIEQQKIDQILKNRGILCDEIWHSPFRRAEETAEIMGQDFGIMPTMELLLGDFFEAEELFEKIPKNKSNYVIALVGHAPQLMRFATFCTGYSCYSSAPTPSSILELVFSDDLTAGKAIVTGLYAP